MKIARVFFDVHMGKNFRGLLKICHDHGIKPEAMESSYIVFINTRHTKFKLLAGNQYLVYHDNRDRKIPLDAIRFLPQAFTGNEFSFDVAVRKAILKNLKKIQ